MTDRPAEKDDEQRVKDEERVHDDASGASADEASASKADEHVHEDEPRIRVSGPRELPLVALRETVIFPEMIVPLQVGREKSVAALNAAVAANGPIALVTQRTAEQEDIGSPVELYTVGTLARIAQAVMRTVQAQIEQYVASGAPVPPEAAVAARNISEPGLLADMVAYSPDLSTEQRMELLQTTDVLERLKLVSNFLGRQIEILELKGKIQSEVKSEMDKTQREYILREQLKAIQRELGEEDPQP